MLGRKPINPIGTCFDSAAKMFLLDLRVPGAAVLVHGIGTANAPGQQGKEIAHAWIEWYAQDLERRVALDPIWGVVQNVEIYRRGFKCIYSISYSLDEAHLLWKQTDYPGPWDARIRAVIARNTSTKT